MRTPQTRSQMAAAGLGARAFTLIEVMFAVLILGIGLLGLGAILPVVVLQQVQGTQGVAAANVAQSARRTLSADRQGRDTSVAVQLRPVQADASVNTNPRQGRLAGTFDMTVRVGTVSGVLRDVPVSITAGELRQQIERLTPGGLANVNVSGTVVGAGNVEVARSEGPDGVTFVVSFVNALGGLRLGDPTAPPIQVNPSGTSLLEATVSVLSGGAASFGPQFWTNWAMATPRPANAGATDTNVANTIPSNGLWLVPPLETGATPGGPGWDTGAVVLGNVAYTLGNRGPGNSTVIAAPLAVLQERIVRIALAERLWPTDVAGRGLSAAGGARSGDPQYVWDIAVRRRAPLPPINSALGSLAVPAEANQVEVAVFVRSIDARLRPPAGITLFRAVTEQLSAADRRVPVAADVNTGVPTLDGVYSSAAGLLQQGSYSRPIAVNVDFTRTTRPDGREMRDRLVLSAVQPTGVDRDELMRWITQPGQKLVDNLGNVYTVLEPDTRATSAGPASAYAVRLSPTTAVPGGVGYTDDAQDPSARTQPLRQVVFTPQVPASVSVFTVNP